MEEKTSWIQRGLGQTVIYGASIGATKLVALLMLPVFTSFLPPEDYAKLDIIQTLANVLSVVIGFGLADTLFRFTGETDTAEQQQKVASGIFGLALVGSVASLLIFQLLAPAISENLPGDIDLIDVRLILASLSFTGCILVPMAWLRFKSQAMSYFGASAGRNALQALLAALLLFFGFGVTGVLTAGFIAVTALACCLIWYQLKETGISFSWGIIRRQGRYGSVLVLAGVAAFVLDCFDRWILAMHMDLVVVAQYALACKVGVMAAFLTEPYRMWWSARRFKILFAENGLARCAAYTEQGVLIACLSAIGIAGVGGIVVHTLSDGAYLGAIAFVPLIAGISALNAIINLMNVSVLSAENSFKPFYIDGTAAVMAVVGYLLLIPDFGVLGAITSTYVAQITRLLLYILLGLKHNSLPYRYPVLLLYASLAVLAIYFALQAESIWSAFLSGLVLGLIALTLGVLLGTVQLPKRVRAKLLFRATV